MTARALRGTDPEPASGTVALASPRTTAVRYFCQGWGKVTPEARELLEGICREHGATFANPTGLNGCARYWMAALRLDAEQGVWVELSRLGLVVGGELAAHLLESVGA